jgi:hypothetical protein
VGRNGPDSSGTEYGPVAGFSKLGGKPLCFIKGAEVIGHLYVQLASAEGLLSFLFLEKIVRRLSRVMGL